MNKELRIAIVQTMKQFHLSLTSQPNIYKFLPLFHSMWLSKTNNSKKEKSRKKKTLELIHSTKVPENRGN